MPLSVRNIVLFGRVPDLTLTDFAVDAVDASTFTFSARNLGTPDANRLIIVVGGGRAALSETLGAITIGGVSATVDVEARNTASAHLSNAFIAHAIVPTGSTGTVVIPYSGTVSHCGIGIYRVTKYAAAAASKTVTGTRAASAGSIPLTLSAPDVGFQIAVMTSFGGTNRRITSASARGAVSVITPFSQDNESRWVGLNEDVDVVMEAGAAADQAACAAGWKYP